MEYSRVINVSVADKNTQILFSRFSAAFITCKTTILVGQVTNAFIFVQKVWLDMKCPNSVGIVLWQTLAGRP